MNFTMASENIKFDNIEGESNEITLSSEDTEIFDTSNNTQIVYVYEDQLEEELISSDIPSTSNNNKKSRSYKQYYRKEWEDIQDFKGWLQEVPDQPTRAYCLYCDRTLHAHRLSLLKHICTLKHTKAAHHHVSSQVPDAESIDDPLKIKVPVAFPRTFEETFIAKIGTEMAEESPITQEAVISIAEENEDDFAEPPKKITKKFRVNMSTNASPLTTHVLDTSRGLPVSGLQVSLYKLIDGRWTMLSECLTNPDGRINTIIEENSFAAGRYKLHFDVYRYFEMNNIESLYPFVEIVFDVKSPQDHYHIPLLINPFGYSTYKGS